MRSNDTLVDTPFQLISGFFHVNQGVLCCEHAEQASSRGVLEGRGGGGGGGGSNRLPALVAKQQAVEFPQVQTSLDKFFYHLTVSSLSPPNIVVESKN